MKTTAKTAIIKALQFELAMIPAIIVCIYDAFKRAMWDIYDFETRDGYTGGDLVDSFFDMWGELITQNIPILVCLAVIIAILAVIIALRKGKTN